MNRTFLRRDSFALRATTIAAPFAIGLACIGGCEESSPPPSVVGNGTGGKTQQQAAGEIASRGTTSRLDQLAEEPKSLAGRSARTAANAADQIANNQAQAAGAADEITGDGTGFDVAGLRWIMPEGWEKKPPASSMRAGEFHIKGDNNESALVVFSHFPGGQGGDVNSNLERWKSQFRNPETGGEPEFKKHPPRKVAGMTVHVLSIVGTYSDGMPGSGQATERTGYAMRGAIVEGPQGSVFIKMTGPFDVVNSTRDQWYQLVDGMTKK